MASTRRDATVTPSTGPYESLRESRGSFATPSARAGRDGTQLDAYNPERCEGVAIQDADVSLDLAAHGLDKPPPQKQKVSADGDGDDDDEDEDEEE